MCEVIDIEPGSFLHSEGDFKYPSSLHEEINIAETKLLSAQQSFTDHVIESTACINCLRLKLEQLRIQAVNFQEVDAKCLQENKTEPLNKYDRTKHEIAKLQNKLHENVFHSSLSIRRSLMKLSNLLAQHTLLHLPYHELKAYSNQILSYPKSKECLSSKSFSGRLSYSEALLNLEQILEDVENVEERTLYLIGENDNSKYMMNDSHNIIYDEYKCVPQFSTC